MSAEATARVCKNFKITISPDSVLRLLRRTNFSATESVRIFGVDDWAFKRGQNYGTILIDLERCRTIELLPDRTQATLCQWLEKHPAIEIISRDRSFEYKAGIEKGAPQAIQVVDRWHLLHNLREKLQ
jgi:transposase